MSEKPPRTKGELKEGFVFFQTSQGMEVRASLLRMTRFLVVFEIYNSEAVLRTAESLQEFKIF